MEKRLMGTLMSLVIAIAMIFSMFPVTALATDTPLSPDGLPLDPELAAAEPMEDSDGTLLLTGNTISFAGAQAEAGIQAEGRARLLQAQAATDVKRYTVLVLDRSGSMVNPSAVPLTAMRSAAIKFCDAVLKADGENYVAVVSYGSGATINCDFTNDYQTLESVIRGVTAALGQGTNTNMGLQFADNLLRAVSDDTGIIKNVLLLSDGLPQTGVRTNTGRYNSSDYASYPFANTVYNTAISLQEKGYYVYTLGFFHNYSSNFAQRFMNDLQNAGYYNVVNPDDLEFVFGEIAEDISGALKEVTLHIKGDFNRDADAPDIDNVTVEWGDSLFAISPFDYNPKLALVAATLNKAASGKAEHLYDRGSSSTLDPNYSAGYTGEKGDYSLLGFNHVQYYNYEIDYATTLNGSKNNEHCFSIAKKDIIVNGERQLLIAVVARGTEGIHEPFGDASATSDNTVSFHGYNAYKYFSEYEEKIRLAFYDYFSKYVEGNDKYKTVKLLITGHSLGGAAANLFASKFVLDGSIPESIKAKISTNDIYAFTFGALNSVGLNWSKASHRDTFSEDEKDIHTERFGYIHNIFNFYDTFGPDGKGASFPGLGVRPANGEYTYTNKFGKILDFNNVNYDKVFKKSGNDRYRNHDMACYVDAVKYGYTDKYADPSSGYSRLIISIHCPVDISVFDESGNIVARTIDNSADESVAGIPMYVDEGVKYLSLPVDSKYKIDFTAFDSGQMEILIKQTDGVSSSMKWFCDVPINAGKEMTMLAGGEINTADIQLFVLDAQGSPAAEILSDGTEKALTPTEIPLEAITLNKTTAPLTVGQTDTLTVTYNPENTTDSRAVTWSSSAPNIVSVSDTGVVTARTTGTAIITAAVGELTATCTVTVTSASTDYPTPGGGIPSGNPGGTVTIEDEKTPLATVPENVTHGDGGNVTVNDDGELVISPDEGYEIGQILINGKPATEDDLKKLQKTDKVEITFEWANPFTDVAETDWFFDSVRHVSVNKLMLGTSADKFEPNSTLNRAMLATILWRMEGSPEPESENPFTDLTQDWYLKAVIWAAESGIADGYGNGVFAPADNLTREQLAVMLSRYAKHKGIDITTGKDTNILSYDDSFDISDWAFEGLQWACHEGLISGKTETKLDPAGTATRAEMATVLKRYQTELLP